MMREFVAFLKQYGVIGLAIAVIIGGKLNTLVTAVVDGLLMPLITPFVPDGNWREYQTIIGPFTFKFGAVAGSVIDFLIVALVVFWISKKILNEETVTKK